jgi:hypothetical protein
LLPSLSDYPVFLNDPEDSMSDRPNQPPRRPQRRSTGGGGLWLFLLIVLVGVGATYVFAPHVMQEIFGHPARPGSDGADPAAPHDSQLDLGERKSTDSNLTAPSTVDRTLSDKKKPVTPAVTPPSAPKLATFKAEAEAKIYLAEAEKAYKEFAWQKARSSAQKIAPLDASPKVKVRAKDIVRGSAALEKLFTELNDRDELSRGLDTHPSLVEITGSNGQPSFAVPIHSMDDKTLVETDAMEWINGQRRSGKITVMLKGTKDYIASSMPADTVGEIKPADIKKITVEKQSEFRTRLDRLKNGDKVNNALAWYDAAKFAYRNRLDDHVTEMMDKAIMLDPLLDKSVREDRAEVLFANVVAHMNNKNTTQAAAFIAVINRRFGDTEAGKQAKLFYEGKSSELALARKESENRLREEEQKRRAIKIEHAEELGDKDAVAKLKAEPVVEERDEPIASAATGDEAQADALYDKGRDIYQQAISAGNSSNRDDLYSAANKELTAAMAIYNKLLEKSAGNSALEEKAFLCNKLRYGSIKQRRF